MGNTLFNLFHSNSEDACTIGYLPKALSLQNPVLSRARSLSNPAHARTTRKCTREQKRKQNRRRSISEVLRNFCCSNKQCEMSMVAAPSLPTLYRQQAITEVEHIKLRCPLCCNDEDITLCY